MTAVVIQVWRDTDEISDACAVRGCPLPAQRWHDRRPCCLSHTETGMAILELEGVS